MENWEMNPATENQRKMLFSLLANKKMEKEEFEELIGRKITTLTKGEMSEVIDRLMTNKEVEKLPEMPQVSQPAPVNNVIQSNNNTVMPDKSPKNPMIMGDIGEMASFYGIPKQIANMFFTLYNGTLYIKHAGMLFLAGKKGYQRIDTYDRKFNEQTGEWTVTAAVQPIIPKDVLLALGSMSPEAQKEILDYYKPTIAIGRASRDNVKMSTLYPFLPEVAETRAINRALRKYTGYGGTTAEELPDVNTIDEVKE